MAFSGIEIFKMLPKTNCKECGFPTCLAFAMQLATSKVEVEKCPYVLEETKALLADAQAPPIRKVVIGSSIEIGEETVFYRHEKTFVHPPVVTLLIKDTEDSDVWIKKVDSLNNIKFERIGLILSAKLLMLENTSGNPERFLEMVSKINEISEAPFILSGNIDALRKVVPVVLQRKPLLYAADNENFEEMANIAKENNLPLVAKENTLEALSSLTERLMNLGIKDLVLDPSPKTLKEAYYNQIFIRRQALTSKYRPFGFPTIVFPYKLTDDLMKEVLYAGTFVLKYGSIIVLSELHPETLFPLLVLSLNIHTDPQRPMAIEEKIYEINGPDKDSPILITTNFSLTYFIVSGEIETSHVPTWLIVMDTGGLSVLTSWAAGKFNGELIGGFIKKSKIADKISHRRLVIPGYVASIKGEIEEESPDWEIILGPREASDIPIWLQGYSKK
ncbi:TPA: acetyl-CoA decarbonylase/synthase complex subunit gamma [bacterium]|nr:acetyl-CoA decarbonylase/synthase complex subunit gamma [bacterium]